MTLFLFAVVAWLAWRLWRTNQLLEEWLKTPPPEPSQPCRRCEHRAAFRAKLRQYRPGTVIEGVALEPRPKARWDHPLEYDSGDVVILKHQGQPALLAPALEEPVTAELVLGGFIPPLAPEPLVPERLIPMRALPAPTLIDPTRRN